MLAATTVQRWRRWTPAEDRYLRAWWGMAPDSKVAAHLQRSVEACLQRAQKRLGITRSQQVLSLGRVAALFGVSPDTVRFWINQGVLAAERAPFGHPERPVWAITEAACWRFVTDSGHLFDPRRMQPGHWLSALAATHHAADPWLTVPEACQEVHYSQSAVERWLASGKLAHARRPSKAGYRGYVVVVRRSVLRAVVALCS